MAQRYPNMAKTLLQQGPRGRMNPKVCNHNPSYCNISLHFLNDKIQLISYHVFTSFIIIILKGPRAGLPPGASGMRPPFPGGPGGPGMIRGGMPPGGNSIDGSD